VEVTLTGWLTDYTEFAWEFGRTAGQWPEDWVNSVFIPLPKKGDLTQCNNYRTIALVSHASKVLLKIILERIRSKTESEISEVKAGFRISEEDGEPEIR